jgi:hypothetical protein
MALEPSLLVLASARVANGFFPTDRVSVPPPLTLRRRVAALDTSPATRGRAASDSNWPVAAAGTTPHDQGPTSPREAAAAEEKCGTVGADASEKFRSLD